MKKIHYSTSNIAGIIFLLLCCLTPPALHAQLKGGIGDGYDADRFVGQLNGISTLMMYSGGYGQGFARQSRSGYLQGPDFSGVFKGGPGDGYAADNFIGQLNGSSFAVMFQGGPGDGFDQNRTSSRFHGTILPITLISFDAFPQNDYVLVQWVTESEQDNDFFTIERSRDARIFDELTKVPGAGTTLEKQTYQDIDSVPYQGQSYYRLKSTDFDGTFSYSQIIAVNMERAATWDLLVFPNPNIGKTFTINLTGLEPQEEIRIELVDIRGRIVYSQTNRVISGALVLDINLKKSLIAGSYLLRASSASNQLCKLVLVQNRK